LPQRDALPNQGIDSLQFAGGSAKRLPAEGDGGVRSLLATDNLVVMFGAGDRMMGDEFKAAAPPEMQIKVLGTAPIALIEVIKDNAVVYSHRPTATDKLADLTWKDSAAPTGTSFYYIRVQQTDGQLAWSSPMWISYG